MSRLLLSCVGAGAVVIDAEAVVTFKFTFADVIGGTGAGFDDPATGALRRDTLQDVADNVIGAALDHSAEVDIFIRPSRNIPNGTVPLAAAFPSHSANSSSFQRSFANQHILTGIDPSSEPDGELQWNFGLGFNYSASLGATTGNNFDFRSIALHELTHLIGVVSLLGSDGNSFFNGTYSFFDSFLRDSNENALIDDSSGVLGFNANLGVLTSDVQFASVNGTLQTFTPSRFAGGSSLSHLDPDTHPDVVLSPIIAPRAEKRNWSPEDISILETLGYTVIPEPGTALLGILGAGFLICLRRRS